MTEMLKQNSLKTQSNLYIAPLFLSLICYVFLISVANAQKEVEIKDPASNMSIQTVITDQLDAFKRQDNLRAFSHAAPNIKQLFVNADNFILMVKRGYPALYASKLVEYGRTKQVDADFYQEVIVIDPKGNQWKAVYVLSKQDDGSWKIKGVQIIKDSKTAT
ncbi:MAG: DUF4864 domain-containing protein [Nitratireductor sp.]